MGKIKELLSKFSGRRIGTQPQRGRVMSVKSTTTSIVDLISKMSDFDKMSDAEIYEQLYGWEYDIGGAIDRMSTLVRQSYKGVYVDASSNLTEKEARVLRLGRKYSQELEIADYFEAFAEMLMRDGNVFLHVKDDTFTILPYKNVTIVDKKERILSGTPHGEYIQEPKYLVLHEDRPEWQKVIPWNEIRHIKYKHTPTFTYDSRGRLTYGIYSVSPIQRLIMPVWWKRQTMMIDVLWRFRNVPKEHHKIHGDIFDLRYYSGSTEFEKREKATKDSDAFINKYSAMLENVAPDTGYITLDNVEIGMVESSNRSATYQSVNELIGQLDEKTWNALNVPKTIVSGSPAGSFASELIISNYTTSKVTQMASKIRPILLEILRNRISKHDETLPVGKLEMEIELVMSISEMEKYRQAAIKADLGVFTDTEIRGSLGYEPLSEDQLGRLVFNDSDVPISNKIGRAMGLDDYPETPLSSTQHTSDAGEKAYRSAEGMQE